MGLPNINIAFQSKAIEAIKRSQKGVVALIVRDSKGNGSYALTNVTQIPAAIGKGNQDYIARAFTGYVNPPRKVLVYILPAAAEDLTEALTWLGTQVFDYLAGPPDITEGECAAVADWVKGRRFNENAICKAVLPGTAADSEAVVNFAAEGLKAGTTSFTAGQYCSRMAGLIAGTPMTISCTYAPLPELTDVARLSREEGDAAVDAGKLTLIHDGEKVKIGRAVNSLVTTTQEKDAGFRKLKLVEAMDMIGADIRTTAQDSYIGKYANSYDNKLLLLTAIKGYLVTLEQAGILGAGTSTVGIDVEAQEAYLMGQGIDTSKLTEREIKEANTGSVVFLRGRVQILDAIEDINLTLVRE